MPLFPFQILAEKVAYLYTSILGHLSNRNTTLRLELRMVMCLYLSGNSYTHSRGLSSGSGQHISCPRAYNHSCLEIIIQNILPHDSYMKAA